MINVRTNYGTKKSSSLKTSTLSTFKGVDLTSGEVNVSPTRSPDAPNMMPDANGFPVKRPGFWRKYFLLGTVNGRYLFKVGNKVNVNIIHVGTKLHAYGDIVGWDEEHGEYVHVFEGTAVCETMANAHSTAVLLNEKLWILDGTEYKVLYAKEDGDIEVKPVSEIATVPVIVKGKRPPAEGAGSSYNPFNILTQMVEEDFVIMASEAPSEEEGADNRGKYPTNTREFYTTKKIDAATAGAVTARVLRYNSATQQNDEFNYTEGNGFTVDRVKGCITFDTAPGESIPVGEDSVFIKYPHVYEKPDDDDGHTAMTTADGISRVNKNKFSILYGVNGAMDRIFMSGNPDEPNVDRWSQFNDPAYIGDTMYGVMGSVASPIMGYSVLNNKLVTHKINEENDRNAFVRTGSLDDDGDGLFPITNVIQGDGSISCRGYGAMSSEPVFLSKRGVYALTANDITGERYEQKRSYFIDGALARTDLSDAPACVWGRFFVFAVEDRMYLLDTEQKSYEQKVGNSSYQYECYYFEGINAETIWADDNGVLWYGDKSGNIMYLMDDTKRWNYQDNIYADNDKPTALNQGEEIKAYWTTPMLPLSSFGYKKNIHDVWVTAQPYNRSGGTIYYNSNAYYEKKARKYDELVFDWNDIDFDAFTFKSRIAPTVVRTSVRSYGLHLFQVRVENDGNCEPFGIYSIQIDFSVGNKTEVT